MARNHFGSWNAGGTFGDTFGALNAFFAGLAFAGVIIAIFLQSKELELQRKELQQTREELKGQKEQLQSQNKTLRLQSFENTFFQMLRLHNEIVNEFNRLNFRDYYVDYINIYHENKKEDYSISQIDNIRQSYKAYLEKHQERTGHYFRHLYNIIKFVNNKCPIGEKRFYTNLVRAQLSEYELALLFYNCLSSVGNEKFKPLVEQYSLLKNMFMGDLIEERHKDLYDWKAFASSSEIS